MGLTGGDYMERLTAFEETAVEFIQTHMDLLETISLSVYSIVLLWVLFMLIGLFLDGRKAVLNGVAMAALLSEAVLIFVVPISSMEIFFLLSFITVFSAVLSVMELLRKK